ncbi:MAG: DUF2158 domain-containing protein [Ignavibacteria bacterium]|nr:DUF2158 domain-containing protein [Ignavibacteria bacterium]
MEELKLGDVVYLKSGSPGMTITWVENDSCEVSWIDKSGKKHVSQFPKEALTHTDPNAIPPGQIYLH